MKKSLIFLALLALCFGAFALPGLMRQEPVKIPDVKPTSPTSLELRNSIQKMTAALKVAEQPAKAPAHSPARAPQAVERNGDYSYITSLDELTQFTEFYGLDGDFCMSQSDWSYSGRPLSYFYDNDANLRVNLLGDNPHYLSTDADSASNDSTSIGGGLSVYDLTPAKFDFSQYPTDEPIEFWNTCQQVNHSVAGSSTEAKGVITLAQEAGMDEGYAYFYFNQPTNPVDYTRFVQIDSGVNVLQFGDAGMKAGFGGCYFVPSPEQIQGFMRTSVVFRLVPGENASNTSASLNIGVRDINAAGPDLQSISYDDLTANTEDGLWYKAEIEYSPTYALRINFGQLIWGDNIQIAQIKFEGIQSPEEYDSSCTISSGTLDDLMVLNDYSDNTEEPELKKLPPLLPMVAIKDGRAVISTSQPLYADDNETWYLYAVDQNGAFVGHNEDIELWNYDGTIHFMHNGEEVYQLYALALDADGNYLEKYDLISNAVICKPNTTISWNDEEGNAYEDRIYSFLQNDKFTISRLPIVYQTYAIDFDYSNDTFSLFGAPVFPSISIDESSETGDFLMYGYNGELLTELIGYRANNGYDIDFDGEWLLYSDNNWLLNPGFLNSLHISLDYQLGNSSETPSLKYNVPYLVGYFCGWSFYPEYEMAQIGENIYEFQGVNLPAYDEFKIATPDWSTIDLGSYETPLVADQVYTLTERGGNMYLETDLVNANIIVDLSTNQCIIRTDGGHTIEYTYTVSFDNTNANWPNIYAVAIDNNTYMEIAMQEGEDNIWSATFTLDWKVQNISFYADIEDSQNYTTDIFEFRNNAIYNQDGRQLQKLVVVVENENELWLKLANVNKEDVEQLKIIGPLSYNDLYDFHYNFNNVTILDLGEAIFKELPPDFLANKYLITQVILPSTLTSISSEAFYKCHSLEEVTFNGECNVQGVDVLAFYECLSLKTFDLSKVTSIYERAFSGCYSLNNIDLRNTQYLGYRAFYNCTSLEVVNLESIDTIEWDAFGNCSSLHTFICNRLELPYTEGELDSKYVIYDSSCTLYVPLISLNLYSETEPWSLFYNIQPIIGGSVQDLRIETPMELATLSEYVDALDGCKITLGYNDEYDYRVAQVDLTNGGSPLHIGTLAIEGRLNNRDQGSYWSGTKLPSLIVEEGAEVTADAVSVAMQFKSCSDWDIYWHFVSLPFDVLYDDIAPAENTLFIVRTYNCQARAIGDFENTWQNVSNGDLIPANTGFIVSVYNYDNEFPTITFPSAANSNVDGFFNSSSASLELNDIEAELVHNRSWNFIGNPYPAFFDIHQLYDGNGNEFAAPFTVWRGNSYESYCALDDDLVLRPFEGFLLQTPVENNSIRFDGVGRYHWNAAKDWYSPGIYAPERRTEVSQREVFNFTTSYGEEMSNRARIVINEEAKMNYEAARDATKFFEMSNGCPLVYVNGDVKYSICERPLADGAATLGFLAPKNDTYKLSLSGKHADGWQVILKDCLTGAQIDLMENDYEFEAKAGQDDSRFTITFAAPEYSGIQGILNATDPQANVIVSNIAGVNVYQGVFGQMPKLAAGIYLFTIDGKTSKVSINQ